MQRIKGRIENIINKENIESFVDRADKIVDIFMKIGIAFVGYSAWNHWSGALTALIGLKMATGNNLAAGAAGVGVLTTLGIQSAFSDSVSKYPGFLRQLSPVYR